MRTLAGMRNFNIVTATLLLIASGSQGSGMDGHLQVDVDAAEVTIAPGPPGLRLVQLSDLTFKMRIAAHCVEDLRPESIAINIADSRRYVALDADSPAPEQQDANDARTEQTIEVPAQQLAPLTINNFCFDDTASDGDVLVRVPDALSAQLSLNCVGENRQSIIYQSVALSVALTCVIPDAD